MDSINSLLLFLLIFVSGAAVSADVNTAPDGIWIDVRTPTEYENGHLPGAHNINFARIGVRIAEITTDTNALVMLYCRSGRRSGLAKQTLEQLGYLNVVNGGGLDDVLRQAQVQAVTGPRP